MDREVTKQEIVASTVILVKNRNLKALAPRLHTHCKTICQLNITLVSAHLWPGQNTAALILLPYIDQKQSLSWLLSPGFL